MPPSKTGWLGLDLWFFHLRCPLSWTTQNSNTPEIIDQLHELILKDRRISGKWIAEQKAYHVSGLDPSFMKIWTCESSPRSGFRNDWTRIKNFKFVWAKFGFFRRDPNNFLQQRVTKDETWLNHYHQDKKKHSMEWRRSGSPRSIKFRLQKPSGKILASTFWLEEGSLSSFIFQRAKI